MTLDAIIAVPVGIVLLLMAITSLSLRRTREYPATRLGPSSQTGEVPPDCHEPVEWETASPERHEQTTMTAPEVQAWKDKAQVEQVVRGVKAYLN